MHRLEQAVIDSFTAQNFPVLSTSELVGLVFSSEVARISQFDELVAKRERERLHRKLLYHLQKLVASGVLEVVGVQGRGEKRFSLCSKDAAITHGSTKVIIRKNDSFETPIDSLSGVEGFERESWLSKVNALALEGTSFSDLYEASEVIEEFSSFTNDVIGVLRFDSLLGSGDVEEFLDSLSRLSCKVSLVISLVNVSDARRVVRFCRSYSMHRPTNVQVVFNVSARVLHEHQDLLCQVIELFMKRTIKINFKNNNVHAPPIICGRAGAYTLSSRDWLSYKRNRKSGVVLGAASVVVDLQAGHAHNLGREAARALFLVGRRRSELFALLSKKDIACQYSFDMVRFWNYDLFSETLVDELSNAHEVITGFCELQERVYRACGLPIRARIGMSSSFAKAASLSSRSYKKVRVQHLGSLQEPSYQEVLRNRESLCKIFCCDRVRIFRHGNDKAVEVFREISFLLNSFRIPYLTYDFSELKGDVKLTEFLGGGSL